MINILWKSYIESYLKSKRCPCLDIPEKSRKHDLRGAITSSSKYCVPVLGVKATHRFFAELCWELLSVLVLDEIRCQSPQSRYHSVCVHLMDHKMSSRDYNLSKFTLTVVHKDDLLDLLRIISISAVSICFGFFCE